MNSGGVDIDVNDFTEWPDYETFFVDADAYRKKWRKVRVLRHVGINNLFSEMMGEIFMQYFPDSLTTSECYSEAFFWGLWYSDEAREGNYKPLEKEIPEPTTRHQGGPASLDISIPPLLAERIDLDVDKHDVRYRAEYFRKLLRIFMANYPKPNLVRFAEAVPQKDLARYTNEAVGILDPQIEEVDDGEIDAVELMRGVKEDEVVNQ